MAGMTKLVKGLAESVIPGGTWGRGDRPATQGAGRTAIGHSHPAKRFRVRLFVVTSTARIARETCCPYGKYFAPQNL